MSLWSVMYARYVVSAGDDSAEQHRRTPGVSAIPAVDVDLVVNCYERTYRELLRSDRLRQIERDCLVRFRSLIVLINNVIDLDHVMELARSRVSDGSISRVMRVDELLPPAIASTRIPARLLRHHGYFLDYGLAMAFAGESAYVLGWDAEVRLEAPHCWLVDALELLHRDDRVFSAAPRWPAREFDTLDHETWAHEGPWALNYGFTDQLFLVRRSELQRPIYRKIAPAAYCRHPEHPWTFETRLEAYQRSSARYRATHRHARYTHNDTIPVLSRDGLETKRDRLQRLVLAGVGRRLERLPIKSPRWQAIP